MIEVCSLTLIEYVFPSIENLLIWEKENTTKLCVLQQHWMAGLREKNKKMPYIDRSPDSGWMGPLPSFKTLG